MIALDTSAIVAVLQNEPDADRIADRLSAATHLLIGRPTEFELHLVTAGKIGAASARAATERLLADVERIKPRRVVFDSLSELRLLAGSALRPSRACTSWRVRAAALVAIVASFSRRSAPAI